MPVGEALEPLVLGLAPDLESLAGPDLAAKVEALRTTLAAQTGRTPPPFSVVVSPKIRESSYGLRVGQQMMATGDIIPGYSMVHSPAGKALATDLTGFEAAEPVTGYPACWLAPKHLSRARNLGYIVKSPADVLLGHIEAVLRRVTLS